MSPLPQVAIHPPEIVGINWNLELEEPRQGVQLHYDASFSDVGAITWLAMDPLCKVSYNWIVMDTGNIIPLAPAGARAWHGGRCRPRPDEPRLTYRDANSAFYGVAIAATVGDRATREAKRSVAALCLTLFAAQGWPRTEVWRIVSHRAHAWPRGRKSDPEGPTAHPRYPVMSTNEIRGLVAAAG